MAWQRTIPFGYEMKNGEIQCCPTEAQAVKRIFALYTDGLAYSAIAEEMMRQGIGYHKHTPQWNKNMVKRILENERYLGEKEYPQIIEQEHFLNAQLLKGSKTVYAPSPDYINPIRRKSVCGVCGSTMLRDTKTTGKVCWCCANDDCTNRHYIGDSDTRAALATQLAAIAENPSLLEWAMPTQAAELSLETMRIQNEVIRELNKAEPSAEYTKMLILACAAEKYSNLPDCTPHYRLERLREQLHSHPVNEALRNAIFDTAVQKIEWTAKGELCLRLINGKALDPAGKEN